MKKLFKILIILSIFFLPISVHANTDDTVSFETAEETMVVHYFMEHSCPNCRKVTNYFNEYLEDKDNIQLNSYEIITSYENQYLFLDTIEVFDRDANFVPYVVIGGTDLQGEKEIISYFSEVIEYYEDNSDYIDVVEKIKNDQTIFHYEIISNPAQKVINLPFIGDIELETFSLFLGAVFIGLIDGFNPCAMWVLVFLITMLVNLKDRKRIWILGLTFILTSGVIYYIIMISWLQVVLNFAMIHAFQVAIGILAIIFAFFSIKHFWNQMRKDAGCEITSSESRRKIIERARKVIHKNNLWLAIVGIIGIAITVNVIELACSAGLPVIYTSMLAYQNVTNFQSAMYILIYVLFFMLDDIIVFSIAVITLRVTGISNKYAKYSNLIGGLIMLFIGLSLIFFPELLL
ncbi:MAG: hypothetical protein R6U15_04720 [Candidatus Izemoplasmatales bacterium]